MARSLAGKWYLARNQTSSNCLRGRAVVIVCFLAGSFLSLAAYKQPAPTTPGATPAEVANQTASSSPSPTPPRPSGPIEFTDVSAQAGIHFKHNSGAFGKKYLPETLGNGCAFLDFDNDGWQDILIVNSTAWPERKTPRSFLALYHNNQDGTFTDVTRQAGLAVEVYGIGVAAADYDNDGNQDIYI